MFFDDPIAWARRGVGTRSRFFVLASFCLVFPFAIVAITARGSWMAAVGPAGFLGFFQWMILSALKRSVLRIDQSKSMEGTHAEIGPSHI